VEWYWQLTPSLCHTVHQTLVWSIGGMILTADTITVPHCPPNISVEHWGNDTDSGNYHCASVHQTLVWSTGGMILTVETITVPQCPPNIPHRLAWNWTSTYTAINISFYWNYMNKKWMVDGVIVSLQLSPICFSSTTSWWISMKFGTGCPHYKFSCKMSVSAEYNFCFTQVSI